MSSEHSFRFESYQMLISFCGVEELLYEHFLAVDWRGCSLILHVIVNDPLVWSINTVITTFD